MTRTCTRCGQESSAGLCSDCRSEADVQTVKRGEGDFWLTVLVMLTVLSIPYFMMAGL